MLTLGHFHLNHRLSALDSVNLRTLWHRKKGEKLICVNGALRQMTSGEAFKYKYQQSFRDQVDPNLKKAICSLTSGLHKTTLDSDRLEEFIKELFFNKLSVLSSRIYDRSLTDHVVSILSNSITVEDDTIPFHVSPLYLHSYLAAKLWARLGNFTILNGHTGSYRITQGNIVDSYGHIQKSLDLGVFKPSSQDGLSDNNPKSVKKIKSFALKSFLYPLSGTVWDTLVGQGYVAEVAAKIVEKFLLQAVIEYQKTNRLAPKVGRFLQNLTLVPDTHVAHIALGEKPAEVGSFQLWVQETHQDAHQFLGIKKDYNRKFFKKSLSLAECKNILPAEIFDLLVILDVALGNNDRHGANWLILTDAEGQVAGIRLIDNGWAMAPRHPTSWDQIELIHRFQWKNLPLANESFTDLGRFVISFLHNQRQAINREMETIYYQELPEHNKNRERIARMSERIQFMHYAKDKMSKKELAETKIFNPDQNRFQSISETRCIVLLALTAVTLLLTASFSIDQLIQIDCLGRWILCIAGLVAASFTIVALYQCKMKAKPAFNPLQNRIVLI